MALLTTLLDADVPPLAAHVRDRHYTRKHGPTATYGQGH